MNNFYVYEHWRLDRDECFYVGKGSGRRAYSMDKRNRHHKAICNKLSRENSAFEVRIVSCGLSEEEAFTLEKERIQFWKSTGVDLCNMTLGGEGTSGFRHTDKTKKIFSIKRKNAKRDPVKNKERMVKKLKEVHNGNTYRLGKKHTKDVKEKLSKHGHKNFDIFKQYMKLGPDSLSRTVLCVDDGKTFKSASEAARHYSVSKSALIELCLNKNGRKTVGGLKFKYVEMS
jgi:hypothetical protein